MNKTLYALLLSMIFSTLAFAQHSTKTIIEDINTKKYGQGNVRVMQDETIDAKLGLYHMNTDTANVIRLSDERMHGYKIQAFAGNNQNKSRVEAEHKQGLIRAEFPQHQAVVSYDSPSWRLRVGNFITQAEAEAVMGEMKRLLPDLAREMYVVSDVIRRPLSR